MNLANLSDETLLGKVEALVETERFNQVDLLVHLGELDDRDACQRKGYSSVFAYLTRHLGYAECDAMRRVRSARAARRFPSILRLLARGELHLVGIAMLAPYLTSENHRRLLDRACRRSQREIEQMVAKLAPAAPEPRDRIRALPTPIQAPKATQEKILSLSLEPATMSPGQAAPVEPRQLFTFAADGQVRRWFLQARDLLRHKFPQGQMEDIIGEALRRLVEAELSGRARCRKKVKPISSSRHIPQQVRAQVWRHDGGRCSHVGPEGIRCGETAWLEYDHKVPWALGGRSDDPNNIRLLCRAHNQAEARRIFPARAPRPK